MSYANLPHLRSNGASLAKADKPKITAGAGAGTSPTVSVAGADERGVVSVTLGSSPAAGTLATLTFAKPYTHAPDAVLVSPSDSTSATVGGFFASATTTTLTIGTHGTPTTGTLKLNYVVVGGA